MNKLEAEALVKKYNAGLATPEEKTLLERWYVQQGNNISFIETEEDLTALKQELWQGTLERAGLDQPRLLQRSIWPRIAAIAASILIVLSTGAYFYFKSTPTPQKVQVAQNDIAPGKHTATLTLANGKKIILSDAINGQIAKETGVSISKTKNGQIVYNIADKKEGDINPSFNTLSTAKGETYQVNLPDGTQVWLNAASSLIYPTRFNAKERKVTLSGEGYFEVAKDKAHPFIVKSKDQEVTVLGTHFNINAYTDEPNTKTTLLEGSVKLTADKESKIITPGQQVSYTNHQFKVEDIDTEMATAWKNNKFIFDGERIDYIMRMVERWYNVDVIYEGKASTEKFYGGTSRFNNVSEVLKSLEATGKIHFKIENHQIIVQP